MNQREELFTLEELKRAGGRLKANTALGIDGVPNEILKELIGAYPQNILEVFNSCPAEEGQQTSRGCLILYTYFPFGYNREASGGNDSTKTAGSHGRRERPFGEQIWLSERQVHS